MRVNRIRKYQHPATITSFTGCDPKYRGSARQLNMDYLIKKPLKVSDDFYRVVLQTHAVNASSATSSRRIRRSHHENHARK